MQTYLNTAESSGKNRGKGYSMLEDFKKDTCSMYLLKNQNNIIFKISRFPSIKDIIEMDKC